MSSDGLLINIEECRRSLRAWGSLRTEAARLALAGDQRNWSLQLGDQPATMGPYPLGRASGPLRPFDTHLGEAVGLLEFTIAEVQRADSPLEALTSVAVRAMSQRLIGSLGDTAVAAAGLRATGNHIRDRDLVVRFGAMCDPRLGIPVGGVLIGPDGRTYVVAVNGESGGWRTVGVSQQSTVAPPGDALSDRERWAARAAIASGAPIQLIGWQSLGADQHRYITALPDGRIEVSDGTGAPQSFERPLDGPTDGPDEQEHVEPPFPPSESRQATVARVDRANGSFDLAVAAAEAELTVRQIDANNTFVSQVVFEENDQGIRRATINLYQVQTEGSDVRLAHHNGRINSDGELERVRSSELPPERQQQLVARPR